MDVSVTLVKEGDVVQADGSWCITDLRVEDGTPGGRMWLPGCSRPGIVTIGQCFKDAAQRAEGESVRAVPPVYVPDQGGPVCGNLSYGGRSTLADALTEWGIAVRGKRFLVVRTEASGGGLDSNDRARVPYRNGHHVTAVELTADHQIKPDGLRAQFYQTGPFVQECRVQQPQIVGRMEPIYAPFRSV